MSSPFAVSAQDCNGCFGGQAYGFEAIIGGEFFYTVTPCRIVDTRKPAQVVGEYGPTLTSDVERKFQVQDNCGAPVGAGTVHLVLDVTGYFQ